MRGSADSELTVEPDETTAVPPSLWASWEVRQAVLHSSPGMVIAIARRARGLRQDQLGIMAGFSQSAISRIESGGNLAYDVRVLRIFQRLLSIPAHLLGLTEDEVGIAPIDVRRPRTNDSPPTLMQNIMGGALDGHGLLMACAPAAFNAGRDDARTSSPINEEVVRQLLFLRRVVNDADSWISSSSMLPAVRQLYEFVDRLRPLAKGKWRTEILDLAALYAEFCGWLHLQTGDLPGAAWWTERALQQAQAADDQQLVAYAYRRMSMQAELEDDDDRAIGLARAARRHNGLDPQLRAMTLQQEAQSQARIGEEAACLNKLDQARALVEDITPVHTPEYRLGSWFQVRHVELQRAACCVDLGRHREAIAQYEHLRNEGTPTCRWLLGVHLSKLAFAHASTGDMEQASIAGSEALALASSSGSILISRELRKLHPWSKVPSVAGILNALP